VNQRWGFVVGLVLFRLGPPPPQPRVVGPYLTQDVWFPSRLLLEVTDRPEFCAITGGLRYPGYFTPDKAWWAASRIPLEKVRL
jgi:hypothetical protein